MFSLGECAIFPPSNLIFYTRNGKVNLLRLEVDMVMSLKFHFNDPEPTDASEHRKQQHDHHGLLVSSSKQSFRFSQTPTATSATRPSCLSGVSGLWTSYSC